MSRYYEMTVEIGGSRPDRRGDIEDACRQHWCFDDFESDDRSWYDRSAGGVIRATGRSSLCGGESEEEFADRIAAAIWRANAAECKVVVDATYLENMPHEVHWPEFRPEVLEDNEEN